MICCNLHYEKFADGTVKCIEDEIPFEVPDGWEWARLKHVCTMAAGKAKLSTEIKSEPFEGCYPCFGGNGIRGYVDEYNQEGTFSIVGRQGALCGNINIASGKFYATEHAVVTTLFSGIGFDWSNYTLEALQLNKYATGAAQPGLSVANVLNALVSVPPTCEQQRIGGVVSSAITLIEQIALEEEGLQYILNQAKKHILGLAIQGKLVPQNPDDEPASVLLERIRAEKEKLIKQVKIKRDKRESVIFRGEDNSYYETIGGITENIDEEVPFEIPDTWCFARLNSIYIVNPKNDVEDKTTVSFVPMALIDDQFTGHFTCEIKLWKECKRGFTHFADGDVGFAKISPCFENRKSAIFFDLENGYGAGTTELFILRSYCSTILPEYTLNLVKSGYFINRGKGTFSGVVGQQRIDKNVVLETFVPIPPVEEQRRIVKRIARLFSLLDAILSAVE